MNAIFLSVIYFINVEKKLSVECTVDFTCNRVMLRVKLLMFWCLSVTKQLVLTAFM